MSGTDGGGAEMQMQMQMQTEMRIGVMWEGNCLRLGRKSLHLRWLPIHQWPRLYIEKRQVHSHR